MRRAPRANIGDKRRLAPRRPEVTDAALVHDAIVPRVDGAFALGDGRRHPRRLVDRANRAGVVIYAVDARGLVCACLTAADKTGGLSDEGLAAVGAARREALAATQDGLRYLAGETGGFAVVNRNGIPGALDQIAGDLRGYYLIGFQPDADTFSSDGRFRRIRIKVKRPGLKIRTRTGFYGVPTE